jgi:hypothetical protein
MVWTAMRIAEAGGDGLLAREMTGGNNTRRLNVWNDAKKIAEQAAEENRSLTDDEQGRWDA